MRGRILVLERNPLEAMSTTAERALNSGRANEVRIPISLESANHMESDRFGTKTGKFQTTIKEEYSYSGGFLARRYFLAFRKAGGSA